MCFYDDILFKPDDGKIKGYNTVKNTYKEFECSIVNEESKLIKKDKCFIIINNNSIYKFG
jgi:hypothetical protein